jgi:hypothetical protein
MMGDPSLRQTLNLNVVELPFDPSLPPPKRIEAIVNPYLRSVKYPEQRRLFLKKLRIYFLNEYDITGETIGSHHRTNGRIGVRVAKEGGAPIDKEGVLVDHLVDVVKGLMSENPLAVVLWKRSFNDQVKQREKLLDTARPGSKAFADKAKAMIQEIRQTLDVSEHNGGEGQNGVETLPEL